MCHCNPTCLIDWLKFNCSTIIVINEWMSKRSIWHGIDFLRTDYVSICISVPVLRVRSFVIFNRFSTCLPLAFSLQHTKRINKTLFLFSSRLLLETKLCYPMARKSIETPLCRYGLLSVHFFLLLPLLPVSLETEKINVITQINRRTESNNSNTDKRNYVKRIPLDCRWSERNKGKNLRCGARSGSCFFFFFNLAASSFVIVFVVYHAYRPRCTSSHTQPCSLFLSHWCNTHYRLRCARRTTQTNFEWEKEKSITEKRNHKILTSFLIASFLLFSFALAFTQNRCFRF